MHNEKDISPVVFEPAKFSSPLHFGHPNEIFSSFFYYIVFKTVTQLSHMNMFANNVKRKQFGQFLISKVYVFTF